MCSFLFTTKGLENIKKANRYQKRRGPDHTEIYEIDRYSVVHNLLAITGDFTKQPFIKNDIVAFYNGEIYNFKEFGDYATDGECIIGLYEKYGKNFIKMLDGEFAICILDLAKDIVLFSTDIFKTKPLWYSLKDGEIGISTYKSALEALGHEDIVCATPNTNYLYEIKSQKLSSENVYVFDLNQHKDSYEDWIKAFENAIKKRTSNTSEKVFIGLSSGYDSGAIFCELLKQNIDFSAYSIAGEENMEVLLKRHAMSHKSMFLDNSKASFNTVLKHVYRNCEKYNHPYFSLEEDESTWGLGLVSTQAVKDGSKVFLSGTGADEIVSDYGFNGIKYNNNSEFGGLYPKDLSSIFPWRNFFYGSQECYLAREEYVSGSYGLEARYPFLDKFVVQEFLWLSAELKNKSYKAPIKEYLEQNDFPYEEEKIGFFFFKHDFDVNSVDPLKDKIKQP